MILDSQEGLSSTWLVGWLVGWLASEPCENINYHSCLHSWNGYESTR